MAQFYGTLQGNRGLATRLGAKNSGLVVQAASWTGCIETRIYYDEERERNMFRVWLTPWGSSEGMGRIIAEGVLDSSIKDPYIPALIA